MAQDEFGNYRASLNDCCITVVPLPGQAVQLGSGAPTLTTPISLIYIDSTTGDIYTNPTLSHDGWTAAGGGGTSAVAHGVGDPISLGISVITYKVFIDETNPTAPSLWLVSAGAWQQVIA